METKAGSSVFHLKSGGRCFLCRSKVPPQQINSEDGESGLVQPVSKSYPRYSLQYLSHYLGLDLGGGTQGDGGQQSLETQTQAKVGKSGLKVILCEGCAALIGNFSAMYQQLEENKMEDTKCLSTVEGRLTQAKEKVVANCLRDEELEVLKTVRKEIKKKCSTKLERTGPRVRIEKLGRESFQRLMKAGEGSREKKVPGTLASDPLDIEPENKRRGRKRKRKIIPVHAMEAENPDLSDVSDAGSSEWNPQNFIPELDEPSDDDDYTSAADKNQPLAATSSIEKKMLEAFHQRVKTPTKKKGGMGKRRTVPVEVMEVDSDSADSTNVSDNESESSDWKPEEDSVSEGEADEAVSGGESSEWEPEPEDIMPEAEGDDDVSEDANTTDKDEDESAEDEAALPRTKDRGRKQRHFEKNPDTGKFKCSVCDDEFEQISATSDHYRNAHLNLKNFPCKICGKQYTTQEGLSGHHRAFHLKLKTHQCDKCGEQFRTSSNLNYHRRKVHLGVGQNEIVNKMDFERNPDTGLFKCKDCDEVFDMISTARTHYRDVHLKIDGVTCEICGQQYVNQAGLKLHITVMHSGIGSNGSTLPEEKVDVEMSALLNDKDAESAERMKCFKRNPITGKFPCPACQKEFVSRNPTNIHYETVHLKLRRFQCDICGKNYGCQNELKKHHQAAHLPHLKKKGNHRCEICEKNFNFKSSLRLHHKRIHLNIPDQPKPYRYRCEEEGCGREFKAKENLERHRLVVHLKTKPYQCDECGKQFATKTELKQHHQTIHLKLKPHQCDQCGMQFSIKQGLLNHHKSEHLGIKKIPAKRFQCDQCDKSCSTKQHLEEHVQSKHQNIKYTCEECGKQYTSINGLQKHKKVMKH